MQLELMALDFRRTAQRAGADETQVVMQNKVLTRDGFQYQRPFRDKIITCTASLTIRVGRRIGFVEIEGGRSGDGAVMLGRAIQEVAEHGQVMAMPPLPTLRAETEPEHEFVAAEDLSLVYESMPDLVHGQLDWATTQTITLSSKGDLNQIMQHSGQFLLDLVPPNLSTQHPFLRLHSVFKTIDQFNQQTAPAIALARAGLPPYVSQPNLKGVVAIMSDALKRVVQIVPGLSSVLNRVPVVLDEPLPDADWAVWDLRLVANPTCAQAQDLLLIATKAAPDPVTTQVRMADWQVKLLNAITAVAPSSGETRDQGFPWQTAILKL